MIARNKTKRPRCVPQIGCTIIVSNVLAIKGSAVSKLDALPERSGNNVTPLPKATGFENPIPNTAILIPAIIGVNPTV